jgi:membrane protease YdiL (CAAX protease family)
MICYRLTQTEGFSTTDMLIYPLIFGGGSIILILLLNKYLVRDSFKSTFNPGKGTLYKDVLVGLGLTVIYFAMFFLERATLYQWIPNNNPPNTEIFDTIRYISSRPILIFIWFVPVLWIGVALFEELSRTFLLKCLWNISDNKGWEVFVIFIASALIGIVHLYQGTAGIISIGLKSLVACFYFYRYRRLFPLIISHALYDGLQIAFLIVQIQG